MKKIMEFNKAEKVVFIIGIISILIIISAGMLKQQFTEKEVYVPKEIETSSEINLKHDKFVVAKESTLSTNIKDYINVEESAANDFTLDVSDVNMDVIGSYNAKIKSPKQTKEFTITVVKDVNPTLTVTHASFQFKVESKTTIEEIKEYAGVKALDALGNDISASITGWESSIPSQGKTVVYTLKALDQYGHSATTEVKVEYIY